MCVFETSAKSLTGHLIYSDAYMNSENAGFFCPDEGAKLPMLNRFAKVPVVGILAGLTRAVIAVAHIVIHLFAALFTLDMGHLGHAVKGFAELGRGLIEATPIAGRIFAHLYDPAISCKARSDILDGQQSWMFFLVKIRDPEQDNWDPIDWALHQRGI